MSQSHGIIEPSVPTPHRRAAAHAATLSTTRALAPTTTATRRPLAAVTPASASIMGIPTSNGREYRPCQYVPVVSPVYSSNTHEATTVATRRQTAQHASPDPTVSEAATRTPSAAHTRTIDTAGCEVSSQPSTPIASMRVVPGLADDPRREAGVPTARAGDEDHRRAERGEHRAGGQQDDPPDAAAHPLAPQPPRRLGRDEDERRQRDEPGHARVVGDAPRRGHQRRAGDDDLGPDAEGAPPLGERPSGSTQGDGEGDAGPDQAVAAGECRARPNRTR